MRFGVHVSIQGGMVKMAMSAARLGCEAVQIFSRSPRGGKAKPLIPKEVAEMRRLFHEHDVNPLIVHAPYFINLASADKRKRGYSIEVLVEDLKRAETLGAAFVVAHVGHGMSGEPPNTVSALSRVIDSISEVLSIYSGSVKLLMENTAGQGRELGASFHALGRLIRGLPEGRVGTCFDTCHAFSYGYDLSDPGKVDRILREYDEIIGLDVIKVFHLNDSKAVLGSHKDRHEHIGKGMIGLAGFEAIINSPRLNSEIPGILETPIDCSFGDEDNLSTLKSLRAEKG